MFWFIILTIVFVVISIALVLVILVQRPQGGGLAGAFGGAGGGGTDTVFGGRVGDALTWATVIGFALWLLVAIGLNMRGAATTSETAAADTTETDTDTGTEDTGLDGQTPSPADTAQPGDGAAPTDAAPIPLIPPSSEDAPAGTDPETTDPDGAPE